MIGVLNYFCKMFNKNIFKKKYLLYFFTAKHLTFQYNATVKTELELNFSEQLQNKLNPQKHFDV